MIRTPPPPPSRLRSACSAYCRSRSSAASSLRPPAPPIRTNQSSCFSWATMAITSRPCASASSSRHGPAAASTSRTPTKSPPSIRRRSPITTASSSMRTRRKSQPEQEQALLDFVAGGKGLIAAALRVVLLSQFAEVRRTRRGAIPEARHRHVSHDGRRQPSIRSCAASVGFESWDETYVHAKHNEKDRTVLEYRAEASGKEPWTWVRTHGKGRVFYTAWGHDQRTWGNPGFQNLVERGIRWATRRRSGRGRAVRRRSRLSAPRDDADANKTCSRSSTSMSASRFRITRPAGSGACRAKPFSKMQKPLAPRNRMKHIVTPKGFHAELFASRSRDLAASRSA